MKYLRFFDSKNAYDNESYKLPYPCVSQVDDADDTYDALIYEDEPSWVKCTYEIPQEAFTEENSTVNIMENAKRYIKAYKVNGEIVDIEPVKVEEGVQIDVFQPMEMDGMTFYLPSLDACPLAETITTATTFKLSRQVDVTSDYLLLWLYEGDTLADFVPIPIAELGTESLDMFYTFSEDGLSYSYTDMLIEELASAYAGNGFGVFIVDADYIASLQNYGPINPPSITTTMIGRKVTGGIGNITVDQSVLGENNRCVIEYKLHDNVTLIDKHFNNINYLKEIDFSRLSSRRKHSIGKFAFENNGSIEKIVFNTPNIELIEYYAFSNCINLHTIDLDGLTTISCAMFSGCTSLNNIIWGEKLTELHDSAFSHCTSLTSLTIPSTVTSVHSSVFNGCDKLREITLYGWSNTLTKEFFNASKNSVEKISILGGVTSLGTSVFYGYSALREVVIGDSVRYINNSAFSSCNNLTNITLGNNLEYIGSSAFYNCTSLTEIIIPDKVKEINASTFNGCINLVNVSIGASVEMFYGNPFSGCTSLPVIDNIRYADTCLVEVVDKSLTAYTIKEGTKGISSGAFYNCTNLTSITIPDSVTIIDSSTFRKCTSLSSITIPDNVTHIGDNAFCYCTNLSSITIPDSVTEIHNNAFRDCSGLTSVNFSNGLQKIWHHAFENCTSLSSITIPDSVTEIQNHAFKGCSGLISVILGRGITIMRGGSLESTVPGPFSYCTSLTSITCKAIIAPNVTGLTFPSCPSTGTLYYPKDSDYSTWLSTLGNGWVGIEMEF